MLVSAARPICIAAAASLPWMPWAAQADTKVSTGEIAAIDLS